MTVPAVTAWAQQAGEVFNRVADSVGIVLVFNSDNRLVASGSAVTVGLQTMVTNRHVVPPLHTYMVLIAGFRHDATIGMCDDVQDLCLLNVPGLEAKPVEFGSTAKLKVGDPVYAIGAPNEVRNMMAVSAVTKQKTISPPQLTLSNGLVTALRPVEDGEIIQTNAAISPGSSGGGLFDAKGRLVGITTFQMRDAQGLNMALPIEWVQRLGVSGAAPSSESAAAPAPVSQIASVRHIEEADHGASQAASAPPETAVSGPAKTEEGSNRLLWGAIPAALIALLILRRMRSGGDEEETYVSEPDPVHQGFAAQAAAELESNQANPELWNQLIADYKGNMAAARDAYIKRRTAILISAEKDKRWAEAVRQNQTA